MTMELLNKMEEIANTQEPGGQAHDLAWNVYHCVQNNYASKCVDTTKRFINTMTTIIDLVRDLEEADMDYNSEMYMATKAMHLYGAK